MMDFEKRNYREPALSNSHTSWPCSSRRNNQFRSVAVAWPAHITQVLTHAELGPDNGMVAEFESMAI